ncbi:MAG: hypothetical protein HY907_12635 [Deltaproteobacteria bacterium]|nr:hypothetical protein [Deltaproteobacteria bacterium]
MELTTKEVPLETLSILVRPSPETNDHEVVLRSEEGDLISRFGDGMIGLDPDDILVEPCPLLPAAEARTVIVGRCDCGYVGCGSVEVTVSTDGRVVAWTSKERPAGVRFDAVQYTAEVRRALAEHGWETPDRTVARLISSSIDRDHLAHSGLEFAWASGRVHPSTMTIALRTKDGCYQVLGSVPWHGESPEAIAETCRRLLLTEPRTWNDIQWFSTGRAFGPPEIAGPGWRLGKR